MKTHIISRKCLFYNKNYLKISLHGHVLAQIPNLSLMWPAKPKELPTPVLGRSLETLTRLISLKPEYCRAAVSSGQSEMWLRVWKWSQKLFFTATVLPSKQRTHFAHVQVITTFRIPGSKTNLFLSNLIHFWHQQAVLGKYFTHIHLKRTWKKG